MYSITRNRSRNYTCTTDVNNSVSNVYMYGMMQEGKTNNARGVYRYTYAREHFKHTRVHFLLEFLASSSFNLPTAAPFLNPLPPPLPPDSSSIFVPNLFSVRFGWLKLPLTPRMSENLLDLPVPLTFVFAVTVVVCIAKAGIENLFFFRTVSSFRFDEADTLHLTFGGGLNSGLVGDSNASKAGSALTGEGSPVVETEVERYPLAPAAVNAPMLLLIPALEGSRLDFWPVVNPEPGGLPSLKSSRIWR